jgi:hypothetical protein
MGGVITVELSMQTSLTLNSEPNMVSKVSDATPTYPYLYSE